MFFIQNRRYLGCKQKLLPFIHDVVGNNCKGINSVLDLFAGTGVVGYSFNENHAVIVNDILVCNQVVYHTFLGKQEVHLDRLKERIYLYNTLKPTRENYYSDNFSDTYLSHDNMVKIGVIRDNIDEMYDYGMINHREKDVLICSLLYAIDSIANTVGHYDAYRKSGKLDKELILDIPDLPPVEWNQNNEIFQENANDLVKHISADLVYIDPPYNSRQYCDTYHFLENVAQNEKPDVQGVAKKMNTKGLKSKYCTASAYDEFTDLIQNIQAKYILVSYNNTEDKRNDRSNSKISIEQIIDCLNSKGRVRTFEQPYNIFTTGKSEKLNHKEILFLCSV